MTKRRTPSTSRSVCPISEALDVLGDRWTLLVVRDLILRGKRRFSEFLDSPEQIATNILADRLARLEATGIVTRDVDETDRRQVVYAVTAKGLDLVPVLVELIAWGGKHGPSKVVPKSFLKRIARDREALVDEFRQRARRQSR